MDFKNFTTGPDDSQRRLDKVIRKFIPETNLSGVYKFIRKGLIKVNQKKTTPEYRISAGDIISIADFIISQKDFNADSSKTTQLPPVIFRNEHILILDKPYDMTVQGSSQSLDKIVQQDFIANGQKTSLSFLPGPLHRLDRKTTGLIAFSQSLEGAQWFSENIKNHTICKKYLAVLEGKLTKPEEWQDYITKLPDNSEGFHTVSISSTQQNDEGKLAHTFITPLGFGKYKNIEFTLAEVEIKTGRTHQIRSQSSFHGHPLLGDSAYKGSSLNHPFPEFFLQAYKLEFPENNPIGLPLEIKIPPSNLLKSFLKDCDVTNLEL